MASLAQTMLTAAIGLVTGALGAVLISSAQPTRAPASAAGAPSAPATATAAAEKTVVVERVFYPSPVASDTQTAAPATTATAATAPIQPLTAEQETAQHRKLIADHFAEPIDAAWAKPIEGKFERDLGDLGKDAAFDVKEVVCRNVTCRATLRWPSFQDAAKHYAELAKKEYATNCGIHVGLVDDAQPGQPYTTTVLFDCERAKYGD